MKKKPAHGDIRDLEKIGSSDFKKDMVDMTEQELRIRETMQTAREGDDRRIREEQNR